MNIYAGNLSPDVTEDDLRDAFRPFGHVVFVNIVKDRSNRISEGYDFIEMSVQSEGEAAIASLNGKELIRLSEFSRSETTTHPIDRGRQYSHRHGGAVFSIYISLDLTCIKKERSQRYS